MATLDDMAVYFFVRSNLPEEDQMVQVSHAIMEMCLTFDPAFAKYRIVGLDCGSTDKSFGKLFSKLANAKIAHVKYSDPDLPDLGITAIATIPLTKEQALPLANYRLRRYSPSSVASTGVALDGQGRANLNASVAQETEHLVSNQEVAGGIPAGSSIPCS